MADKIKIYARKKADRHLLYLIIILVIISLILFEIYVSVSLIGILILLIALARSPRAWYAFWRLVETIWRKGVKRQYSSYTRWSKGAKGEEMIAEYLENLNNSYKVFNDLKLKDFDGNIDHLVIGKNGIFIIETKNFSGNLFCEKDAWTKEIRGELVYIRSPSIQVKKNAMKLREFIQSKIPIRRLWIQGIVVISNKDCEIQIKEPTVPILQPDQIKDYIKKQETNLAEDYITNIVKLIEDSKVVE